MLAGTTRLPVGADDPGRGVAVAVRAAGRVGLGRGAQENFRGTERFAQWRALIGPHFAGPPVVEHFIDVPA